MRGVYERKACSLTGERSATVSLTHPLATVSLSLSLSLSLLPTRCMFTYICMHAYIHVYLSINWRRLSFIYLFTHDALPLAVVMCRRQPRHVSTPHTLANQIVPSPCHFANTNSRRQWLRCWRPERNEPTIQPKNCFWYFTHHALHVVSSGAAWRDAGVRDRIALHSRMATLVDYNCHDVALFGSRAYKVRWRGRKLVCFLFPVCF